MAKSPWFPISTAPKNGTEVLVCEFVGTDEPFVCIAAWVKPESENAEPGWWGAATAYRDIGTLPHRWKMIAITPACWQPLPEPEDGRALRRRYAQILRKPRHD